MYTSAACLILSLLLAPVPSPGEEGSRLYPVVVKGKWGYIDNTGKVTIEPRFGDKAESAATSTGRER
jgi:hypothetical protein